MTVPPPPSAAPEPPARLYDIRYSRFSGTLQPRNRSVAALAQSSVSRTLGFRKSTGAKLWPFLLLAVAYIIPLVIVAVPALVGLDQSPTELVSYSQLLNNTALLVVTFAATTVPSLLTGERRDRVLSLYFSTAVSPLEYVVAKVLAAVGLLLLVTLGPLLVLFLGSLLTADAPLRFLVDHGGDVPRLVGASLLIAGYHAALGLALGSLTARRVFAVGSYLGVVLVLPTIGMLLYFQTDVVAWRVLDLVSTPVTLASYWLPGTRLSEAAPGSGLLWSAWLVVLLGGLAVLASRYRAGEE